MWRENTKIYQLLRILPQTPLGAGWRTSVLKTLIIDPSPNVFLQKSPPLVMHGPTLRSVSTIVMSDRTSVCRR